MAGLPFNGPSIFGAFVGLDRRNQSGLMICGWVASCCLCKAALYPPSLAMYAVTGTHPDTT